MTGYDRAFSGCARREVSAWASARLEGGFMAKWVRVAYQGREYFGKLEGDTVRVHSGNMFAAPEATSQASPLAATKLHTARAPSKIIVLIDHCHGLHAKLHDDRPKEHVYFLKTSNSFVTHGATI